MFKFVHSKDKLLSFGSSITVTTNDLTIRHKYTLYQMDEVDMDFSEHST